MNARGTSRLRVFAARLRGLLRGPRHDEQFDDEIQEHLRLLEDRYVAQGLSRGDAALTARRQFGNTTLLQEDRRALQTLPSVESLWRDLRYALRTVGRNPAFAAVAITTLGLGIGAATAIYSVIHNVMLAPFPYQHADRLVFPRIYDLQQGPEIGRQGYSAPEVLAFVAASDVSGNLPEATRRTRRYLDRVRGRSDQEDALHGAGSGRAAPVDCVRQLEVAGHAEPGAAQALFRQVTAGYFPALRVKFRQGRPLSEADVTDARRVAVVNEAFVRKYLLDDQPIGQRVRLASLEPAADPGRDPGFEIVGSAASQGPRWELDSPGRTARGRSVHQPWHGLGRLRNASGHRTRPIQRLARR